MGKGSRAREKREEEIQNTPKQKKNNGKTVRNIILSVTGCLVAILLIFGMLYGNGVLQRSMTAVSIGDQKVNAVEYSYYYSQIRTNFINTYGNTLSQSGIDVTNIDDQKFSEDLTFKEYFKQATMTQLTNLYSTYNEAKAASYELSEDGKTTLDQTIAQLTTAAEEQKSTEEKLLRNIVKAPITFDEYKEIIERSVYANTYYNEKVATAEFSDSDVQTYYNENKNQFDKADYRVMQFFFETGADDTETAKNKEEAKAKADAMLAKVTDEKSFIALSKENAPDDKKADYEDDDATLTKGADLSSAAGVVADWYKDESRKAGDKAVLEIDTNYSVVYFVNRYLDEQKTIDVRHILLESDETNDAEIKANAEALLAEWKSGEKSEDSFATLAKVNTADGGSKENGGLYEGVKKGDMVAEFENWCFENGRKTGDTGIVKTSYGYHIMYFVKQGEATWKASVKTALENDEYTKFIEASSSKYDIKSNGFAIWLAI